MRETPRGFYGIGVYNPKHASNYGVLQRSSMNFGSDFTFAIGLRYRLYKSDTCKSFRHSPHFHFDKFEDFIQSKPRESVLVGMEISTRAKSLKSFVHPERAVYMLGAEDHGIPDSILLKCDLIVQIPSKTLESLNLGVAGGLLMYDRLIKRGEL